MDSSQSQQAQPVPKGSASLGHIQMQFSVYKFLSIRALSEVCDVTALRSEVSRPAFPRTVPAGVSKALAHDCIDKFLLRAPSSIGEESFVDEQASDGPGEDGPELNVTSIHTFIGSDRHQTAGGVPKPKVLAQVSGTGLAPWEIHRPQRFVRDLVLRRCFSGRVLDSGCGIGDNALYVAKACAGAQVTAVDVVPRCLEFASAKAGLRGMRGALELEAADLRDQDPDRLPPALGRGRDGSFSVVLDSSTFHIFSDPDREAYVAALRRLLRPGGLIYMNCMSEEETRPGGPRRITVQDLLSVFNRPLGWEVETIEDSIIELHPTFWGGKAKARLFTIRKL